MTCFWDSILKHVRNEDFEKIFNLSKEPSPQELCDLLKKRNIKTENVLWNNEELSVQQKNENFEMIQSFQTQNIQKGYLCSCFDPFLFLVCELFQITIKNKYNQSMILYQPKNESYYTIQLSNNQSHMW